MARNINEIGNWGCFAIFWGSVAAYVRAKPVIQRKRRSLEKSVFEVFEVEAHDLWESAEGCDFARSTLNYLKPRTPSFNVELFC